MALSMTITGTSADRANLYVFGTLTASGTYSTGGDTLDFSAKGDLPIASAPRQVWVGGATGDSYGWVAGTSLANGKVKINTASGTELAQAAYPARITGDTNIQFEAVFSKLA